MTVAETGLGWASRASGLALALIVAAGLLLGTAGEPNRRSVAASRDLPLYFVENGGRLPAAVRLQAQGATSGVYFMKDRVRLLVDHGVTDDAVDLAFVGAGKGSEPVLRGRLAGHVNYIRGSSRLVLRTYREVAYRNVWPQVDVVFKGTGGKLEYSLVLRPGARLGDVRLAYRGARHIAVGEMGGLVVATPNGAFMDARPHAYQVVDGVKRTVATSFAVKDTTSYGFDVGTHDGSAPLVIDPGIAYAALIRAVVGDSAGGVAVDGRGSAYVVGEAASGFPTTPGAYDESQNGFDDAFVTKLSADGSRLVYSTYLGGSAGSARAFDVDVDRDGSAYVVGDTAASNYPTTPGAFDREYNPIEAFVTKLSPDGSRLEYSTFFGGRGTDNSQGQENDTAFAVDVDAQGSAYVAGNTASDSIPLSPGAVITNVHIDSGFVFKLNPQGSALAYSTYLGSTHYGSIDVAADPAGNAYVAGEEIFEDVPVTPGAFDTSGPGRFESPDDAYALKLSADAARVVYGTYLGGTQHDRGFRVAVNERGEATVLGDTESSDFPTTPGAHATSRAGSFDAFVTRLNAAGSALVFSTYLGGTSYDGGSAMGIALDQMDRAIVTGRTASRNFPMTADAADSTFGGSEDAFLSAIGPDGRLSYSSYLPGGSGAEFPFGLAVDSRGDAYATGETFSSNYPTTPGAYTSGGRGVFATKIDLPPSDPATLTLAPRTATNTVDAQHCVTATVRDRFGAPSDGVEVVFEVRGANRAGATQATDAAGQASFCYPGELFGDDAITAFADFNPRNGRRDASAFPPEPQDQATKTWALPDGCKVKVNGRGAIEAQNGDLATFKAIVRAQNNSTRANLSYTDRGPAEQIDFRPEEILRVACGPADAVTVFGRARVNGTPGVSFRVDLLDTGGPGRRSDSFRILLGTGYDSGRQTLLKGDVRVH